MSFFGNHVNLTPASQSDWNKNNSKDAAHIKNRPFFIDDNGEIHKLNKDFLPDEVALKEDIRVTSVNGMTGDVVIEAGGGDSVIISDGIYVQENEPMGAEDGALWVDLDEEIEVEQPGVGQFGLGENAEVFNGIDPANASGDYSHAEGYYTTASGYGSHAEGCETEADGDYSHTEGYETVAVGESSHVQGAYNIIDSGGRYAHIVGNGEWDIYANEPIRSNAHTLDWNGNAWFQGDVFVGGTSQDDADRLVKLSEIGNIGGGGGGSGVQPDWNQNDETAPDYIKNKPFGALEGGWEIVWDGNISNQNNVVSTGNAESILYYVSEMVPSEEELKKATITLIENGESASVELSPVWGSIATITEDLIEIGNAAIITKKDNVTYADTMTFPRAGVYFASMQNAGYVSKLEKVGNIKKIEQKYLPIIYSIDDLEAGVSPLETGTLYFVYE